MLRIFLKLFLIIAVSFYPDTAFGMKDKIHPSLSKKLTTSLDTKSEQTFNIFIQFPSVSSTVFHSTEYKLVRQGGDRKARDEFIHSRLSAATAESQEPFKKYLKTHFKDNFPKIHAFWITNAISMKNVYAKDIYKIAAEFTGEFSIEEASQFQALPLLPSAESTINPLANCSKDAANGFQWGINFINAPAVQAYANGSRVAILVIDTGINADHEAFKVFELIQ
jgi:hypothetical protein